MDSQKEKALVKVSRVGTVGICFCGIFTKQEDKKKEKKYKMPVCLHRLTQREKEVWKNSKCFIEGFHKYFSTLTNSQQNTVICYNRVT